MNGKQTLPGTYEMVKRCEADSLEPKRTFRVPALDEQAAAAHIHAVISLQPSQQLIPLLIVATCSFVASDDGCPSRSNEHVWSPELLTPFRRHAVLIRVTVKRSQLLLTLLPPVRAPTQSRGIREPDSVTGRRCGPPYQACVFRAQCVSDGSDGHL